MNNKSTANEPCNPRWLAEIARLLPIRSQFVVSGNVRDIHICNDKLMPTTDALWEQLREQGYSFLAVYDRADGLSLKFVDAALKGKAEELLAGGGNVSLDKLPEVIRSVVTAKDIRGALVIDFASRLVSNGQPFSDPAENLFILCEKVANSAMPLFIKDQGKVPLYNPLIWLVNRDNDLPPWFVRDNELVSSLVVALPDFEERSHAAVLLAGQFTNGVAATDEEKQRFAKEFATHTEGLTLRGMFSVAILAKTAGIPLCDVDDAVRGYKVGITESPWKKPYLRDKVKEATASISKRVKGQERAITKSIDILIRSIMGLTGAQSPSTSSRPRGVLFFAGPTGVGKTELAKSITGLLFGDDRAYIRFDMSEFSQEHSDARLIGAPPGYVGYDAGGELTKGVRSRPFSVILFDEIEKAHPRILDKFLQILEDGRLTDGQGQTVYFSESVIIFTSNLGIYVSGADGTRLQNVAPGDPYEAVENRIKDAIGNHFKFVLNRPEILNRIGDNVVVFNFITPDIAIEIFNGMFANVMGRVREEHGITLNVEPGVLDKLMQCAVADLSNGGRGIGNRIESMFVEPLARALFERKGDSQTVTVMTWEETHTGYRVVLG